MYNGQHNTKPVGGQAILQTVTTHTFLRGLEPANPAAGISSNAEDMAKWMNFLLGHGPPEMDNRFVQMTFVPELVNSNTPYFSKPGDPVTMEATNFNCRGWYAGHYRGKCRLLLVFVYHL